MDPDTFRRIANIINALEKEAVKNGFVTFDKKVSKTEGGHYGVFLILVEEKKTH